MARERERQKGERVLTEGQEEWIQKVSLLEREIENSQKQVEQEEMRNKDLMDQLVNFEEDKQQFILKIKELEEDNIRLMKCGKEKINRSDNHEITLTIKTEQEKRIDSEQAIQLWINKYSKTMEELKETTEFISEMKDQMDEIESELVELKESKELQTQLIYLTKTND